MALNYLRQYARQSVPESVPLTTSVPSNTPLEELLGGTLLSDADGSYFLTETAWHSEHRHGLHPVGHLKGLTTSQFALICLDPELAYTELSRAVFLDTETTGLNMGTGTYVFLVGAGYFEDDHFKVRQFLLRSPGEESSFLAALDAFLRRFSVLVTFNGKAFDWPLLENRFLRHREFRAAPLDDPVHIDLLHPSRRLWKGRLASCALSSLEKNILSVTRTGDDVPGWLIPSLYFTFLRTGAASALQGVFYHNLQDILSLASLAIHIDHVLDDPMAGLVSEPIDFLCLAKTYERAGETISAIACFEEALKRGVHGSHRQECLMRLGGVFKRERRWDGALAAWESLIDEGGVHALFGLIERAKYYEHVEREYMEALDDVHQAIQLADLRDSRGLEIDRKGLEHRRSRLLNRVYSGRSWVREHV